jgi:hypothetical protein
VRGLTDDGGKFSLTVVDGSGEYVLYLGMIGHTPVRRRLTRVGGDTVFQVDETLRTIPTRLAAVQVRTSRPRPPRAFSFDNPSHGGDAADKTVDGMNGSLAPELLGDIAAMASLVPGLTPRATGGYSAFALTPADNKATLNGLTFDASAIPRDLATDTRFLIVPWDPTVGGFDGALAAITILPGSNLTDRQMHVQFPALQVSDPVARQFGEASSTAGVSLGGSGAILLDKYFYNFGAQVSRSTTSIGSLLDLDANTLSSAGIARDSATRVLQALTALGIPVGTPPSNITTTRASVMARFDRQLPAGPPGATPPTTASALVYGIGSHSAALDLGPASVPSASAHASSFDFGAQATVSAYLGRDGRFVNETATGVAVSHANTSPDLSAPAGAVLLHSDVDGAPGTMGTVIFGGGSVLQDARTWAWEATNQTSFLVGGKPSLPFRFSLESRFQGSSATATGDPWGRFTFASLDALRNNRASSYTRSLGQHSADASNWNGAAAIAGMWNTRRVRVIGGVRADILEFLSAPRLNDSLEAALGVTNDNNPSSFGLSPRIGFQWFYGHGMRVLGSPISTYNYSGSQIRGGIGLFRSAVPSSLMLGSARNTGLPGRTLLVQCVGDATPVPDWAAYLSDPTSAPTACADQSSGLAMSAPPVQMLAPSYKPPASWRGALGWTGRLRGQYLALDGAYALNRNRPSIVDINFAGVPRFTLPDEGGRPVYVPATSIDPRSGLTSASLGRVSPAFGPVTERLSDLESRTRQFTAYAIPSVPYRYGLFSIWYAFTDSRVQHRGFDAADGTNPSDIEWSADPLTPRHQLMFQYGRILAHGSLGITASLRLSSGLRYTPSVLGDVNGDGVAGDRAFILPQTGGPADSLGAAIDELTRTAPAGASACLRAQRGQLAARASCLGPWATDLILGAYILPSLPYTHDRAHIDISIANPLGGLDQLLHGSEHLRGWGTNAAPDPILYTVRGFDSTAQKFHYAVNPRFGSVDAARNTIRAPFRLSIELALKLGRPYREQLLDQRLRMTAPQAGTRAPADSLARRYSKGFPDVYGMILRVADSLALSADQIQQAQRRRAILQREVNGVFDALGRILAALPAHYDHAEALQDVSHADSLAWDAVWAEQPQLAAFFTPGQVRLLRGPLFSLVTDPKYRRRFYGYR